MNPTFVCILCGGSDDIEAVGEHYICEGCLTCKHNYINFRAGLHDYCLICLQEYFTHYYTFKVCIGNLLDYVRFADSVGLNRVNLLVWSAAEVEDLINAPEVQSEHSSIRSPLSGIPLHHDYIFNKFPYLD